MRRELPSRPSLEHLKAQAKDLLEGHRRADPEALARIREALPAMARLSTDRIARAPFALHDAQSAIAREYGFPSWIALRAHVRAAAATAIEPPAVLPIDDPEPLERALRQLPPDVAAALRAGWSSRRARIALPAALPAVPVRNAVVSPGSVMPLAIGRPGSVAALAAALAAPQPVFAAIAQRTATIEQPTLDDLHETGCLGFVRAHHTAANGHRWILVEGVRWIHVAAVVATEPYLAIRAREQPVTAPPPAVIVPLVQELRARVRDLAAARGRDASPLDAVDDPALIADLVIAHLPCTVEDKTAYAAETALELRLERVIDLLERDLAALRP